MIYYIAYLSNMYCLIRVSRWHIWITLTGILFDNFTCNGVLIANVIYIWPTCSNIDFHRLFRLRSWILSRLYQNMLYDWSWLFYNKLTAFREKGKILKQWITLCGVNSGIWPVFGHVLSPLVHNSCYRRHNV